MADIDEDEENYLRAILLLLNGCRYIALKVLLRSVGGKKKESGKDLDDVLNDAKEKLNSVFDSNQRKKLFPGGESKAQTDTWDISLITGVILNCYKSSVTQPELQAVKTIKYKRNAVLGHSSVASLPYEDYDNVCRELQNAINILSSTFDDTVKQTCEELVNRSLTGSLRTAKEDVKTVKDYDNLCQVLVKKIQELEETNRELRARIERLLEERRDHVFSTVQVIDTGIVIYARGNDTGTRDMAERIVTVVIDEARKREGSDAAMNEIRLAVNDILMEIQQHDMNVGSVEQKCILLRVECKSYNQVLQLIEFTDDEKFQGLLRKLAEALTKHLDLSHPLELAFRISKKSVDGLLAGLRDEDARAKKKNLSLPIQYKSVEGLAYLWRFIEEGKGAGRVERLSKALSKYLRKDISIKLSLNPVQVLKALQDPDLTTMAVGRFGGTVGKPLSESVYMASAEDLNYCKLCHDVQKGTEANKYCLHCNENFCEVCLKKHKESEDNAKPWMHIDLAQSGRSTRSKCMKLADKSTLKCDRCQQEDVEYFCQKHKVMACGSCLEHNHKTCYIDWIQSKAVGVIESKELGDTHDKILDQIENTEEMQNIASTINEENEDNLRQSKGEVEIYYQQLLKNLEHMRNETIRDVENTQRMRSKRSQELIEKNTEYHNELVKLRNKIKLKVEKHKEADAFALMKKAQSLLQSVESLTMDKKTILQRVKYSFEPDKRAEELLPGQCTFGKITEKGDKPENLAHHEKEMEVSTKADERKCSITGCAIMNDDRLLLVDANNSSLKILDKLEESIVEELSMDQLSCFDVVVLPDNQAAVTQPDEGNVVFLNTYGRMKVAKRVKINKKCYGITYSEKRERIYTVCVIPSCIISLDLKGEIQQEIALRGTKDASFSMPQYISVDSNNKFFYVSESSFVARVSLDGKLEKVCKLEDQIELSGMDVLEDNTVLVCSKKSRCVYKISADMKIVEMLGTDIPDAQTVCVLKTNRQMFVCSSDSNSARILEMS